MNWLQQTITDLQQLPLATIGIKSCGLWREQLTDWLADGANSAEVKDFPCLLIEPAGGDWVQRGSLREALSYTIKFHIVQIDLSNSYPQELTNYNIISKFINLLAATDTSKATNWEFVQDEQPRLGERLTDTILTFTCHATETVGAQTTSVANQISTSININL